MAFFQTDSGGGFFRENIRNFHWVKCIRNCGWVKTLIGPDIVVLDGTIYNYKLSRINSMTFNVLFFAYIAT